MRYISVTGRGIEFTKPPIVVKRSLSFCLTSPGTWVEDEFLNIVWKHAGNLCLEVKLRCVYRDPVEKTIAHNYDLLLQTGPRLLGGRQEVNALIAEIEFDMLQHLEIDLKGTHRVARKVTDGEV